MEEGIRMKEITKVYVAGKISGNDKYKQEFARAEIYLKNKGMTVLNPSIIPEGFEQAVYLHICTAMIDVCEAVYFLPTWVDSKGSNYEMGYAKGKGKVIEYL